MYKYTYEESLKLKNREMKGRSLLELPNDYVLFDIETTGLSWEWDEIIEIAALKVKDNKIIDTYEQLFKPNYEIPDYITKINHISNDMVKDCPTIEESLNDFLDFVGDNLLVGHNIASFDINFIYKNAFECYGIWFKNDFVDTRRISQNVFKGEKHHSMEALINRFRIDIEQEHRALSDCSINKQIYDFLVQKIHDENIELGKKKYYKTNYNELISTVDNIDPNNPFFEKIIVFTGTLQKYQRKEAAQIVLNCGGIFKDNLTKDVNYLVVGDTDYREKTNKMKKAFEYKEKGINILIIPESLFYELLENE